MPTLLFDGIAYGMLLFVLSLGLAVTLGLMNFINLAHGAFAMAGGYVLAVLGAAHGWPFAACLLAAFVAAALLGIVVERLVVRPLLARPHLDQVLATMGLVLMAVAAADWAMGPSTLTPVTPEWLRGRWDIGHGAWALGIGHYRLFVIACCAALALALQALLVRTRWGSRLHAAVDDPRAAAALGIPVGRVFLATFAIGSGLAGLGGALGADLLGVDPTFPLRILIEVLIVCAVGGTRGLTGPLVAALMLGVADVLGKYHAPKLGGFVVYALAIAILMLRPHGLAARGGATR